VGRWFVLVAVAILPVARVVAEPHDHADSSHEESSVVPDPAERIHSVELDYEIRRDGTVAFEQRFRLGVAGVAIHRGPVLNFLTAFRGPGGLILDNELEILEVTRDGSPEEFRVEPRDGFTTVFVGSPGRDLEPRIHEYRVRGRTQSDWHRSEGEFAAVFDLVGPLPRLPIEALTARIRLPEDIGISQYTSSVTGVIDPVAEKRGPAVESGVADGVLTVRSTAALGPDRSFFVNLTWPSATFATKSQWLKVMRQHPKLPLAGFSAFLLLWVLVRLVKTMFRHTHAAS